MNTDADIYTNINEGYVTVIGGVNIDIEAKSFEKLIYKDSNPGKVSFSLGGVGFNIARNLGLMGTRVVMLTALGDDHNLSRIKKEAKRFNIDLGHAVTLSGASNQTYLYICGPDGDMELAVSDMELLHSVDCDYIKAHLDVVNASSAVVVDANLDPETLEFIAEHCTVPIFADPVSITKAVRMKNILGKLYAFKPNLIEGEFLSELIAGNSDKGINACASCSDKYISDCPDINTDETIRKSPSSSQDRLYKVAASLNDIGIKHLFLSLGKHGVCCSCAGTDKISSCDRSDCSDGTRHLFIKPCITEDVLNATGGGDAMMAAIVKGFLLGLSDEETASLALAASAMAVESPDTINSDITLTKVLKRAGLYI